MSEAPPGKALCPSCGGNGLALIGGTGYDAVTDCPDCEGGLVDAPLEPLPTQAEWDTIMTSVAEGVEHLQSVGHPECAKALRALGVTADHIWKAAVERDQMLKEKP